MDILSLIKERHSVREYLPKSIEEEKKQTLNSFIDILNKKYHTNVQIFYDDPSLFKNSEASYGNFHGCMNIIALVGDNPETCGYVGELIVLKAQQLGLSTCFVGLTYKRREVKKRVKVNKKEKVQCSIALGYGKSKGHTRKSRDYKDVVEIKDMAIDKFDEVVEACLLAPTAINQQKFKITSVDGEIVIKKVGFGPYIDVDLGIVKAHKDLILGIVNLD